jgi:hypothetical protein
MALSNQEAISKAFHQINAFKRHRVLAEQCRQDGDTSGAIFNELKMYKAIDSVELYLRNLNRNERQLMKEEEENDQD